MKPGFIAQALAGTVLMLAATVAAGGTIQMRLTNGATVVTVSDGSAQDINPLPGVITYLGSVGSFGINVSTGIDGTNLPQPQLMDLNSVNVGTGTLVIEFAQTGLNYGTDPIFLSAGIGGTTTGTVSYELYADATNTLYGTGALIFSGASNGSAFSASSASLFDPSGPFSLYEKVIFSHSSWGVSSFDFAASVPEPGTLGLLGIALAGGIALRQRRRR
jgi:hypothetical protein